MTPLLIYILEKALYGSLMLVWLTLKIDKRLLPWATVSLVLAIGMTIAVTLNEMILTKVTNQVSVKIFYLN